MPKLSADPAQNTHRLPSELALVIFDAIEVAKSLGFEFLWVDKYCIDQTSAAKLQASANLANGLDLLKCGIDNYCRCRER